MIVTEGNDLTASSSEGIARESEEIALEMNDSRGRMINGRNDLENGHNTMVQNSLILRHQNFHFPTSLGFSEVSERANE